MDPVIVFTLCLAGFVLVLTTLRVYTRIFVTKLFGIDDVFLVFAAVTAISYTTLITVMFYHFHLDSGGAPKRPLSIPGDSEATQVASGVLYLLSANLLHISWVCFYYRLVLDSAIMWFRNALHIYIATIMALFVVFLSFIVKLCRPNIPLFDKTPSSECAHRGEIAIAGNVVKTCIDILLVVLPFPLVLGMTMRDSRRRLLLLLLSLSLIEVAVGCFRTYYAWRMLFRADSGLQGTFVYCVGAVEQSLGVICACIPTLQPLVRPWMSRFTLMISNTIPQILSKDRSPSNQPSPQRTEIWVDPIDRIWRISEEVLPEELIRPSVENYPVSATQTRSPVEKISPR